MSSDIDIANLALAHIGEEANVSSFDPPEGGHHAEACARFYPMARDALLEMHPWSFATARASSPAQRASETSVWQYAYVLPSDCLKPFAVLPPGATGDYSSLLPPVVNYANPYALPFAYFPAYQTQPFAEETLTDGTVVVYTNQASADIRYIRRVTNSGVFPPLVVLALARLLASYLAGPVIKGDVGRNEAKGQYQFFRTEFSQAAVSDANQSYTTTQHIVPWMQGRR